VLGKVNCSGMRQSKKERERGGSRGTRRTKEQVLVVDKEKGRRGCLAGKQRARSIKTGQLGRGFLGPGFPLGSRVSSIRKLPRPLYPDNSAHLSLIVSIPLSGHPLLTLLSCMHSLCHFVYAVLLVCDHTESFCSADRELNVPMLCSCASF
jgi:hypothetical protein